MEEKTFPLESLNEREIEYSKRWYLEGKPIFMNAKYMTEFYLFHISLLNEYYEDTPFYIIWELPMENRGAIIPKLSMKFGKEIKNMESCNTTQANI